MAAWKESDWDEKAVLDWQKDEVVSQERIWMEQTTRNGSWITAGTHDLNAMVLYWEEFLDNTHLQYGMIPLNIPKYYNGFRNKFTVEYSLF